MKIITDITQFPKHPVVLTIGNFDGVHKGHQSVLNRLKQVAADRHEYKAAITFNNHPSQVLRPAQPVKLITTLSHRLKLFRDQHLDYLLLLEFTKEFSQQSAEDFLRKMKSYIAFSHLILGHDAALGRDRQGDPGTITKLSKELGFTVEYIDEWMANGTQVSSSVIRRCVQEGDFLKIEQLLGRPYSIMGEVVHGEKQGKKLGYPTANLDVSQLCLPPLGVYAVTMNYQNKILKGVANLGIAPTMRSNPVPVLEVHLFQPKDNLYGEQVEVYFQGYIRPEKKFESPEQLKAAIADDVKTAHRILSTY